MRRIVQRTLFVSAFFLVAVGCKQQQASVIKEDAAAPGVAGDDGLAALVAEQIKKEPHTEGGDTFADGTPVTAAEVEGSGSMGLKLSDEDPAQRGDRSDGGQTEGDKGNGDTSGKGDGDEGGPVWTAELVDAVTAEIGGGAGANLSEGGGPTLSDSAIAAEVGAERSQVYKEIEAQIEELKREAEGGGNSGDKGGDKTPDEKTAPGDKTAETDRGGLLLNDSAEITRIRGEIARMEESLRRLRLAVSSVEARSNLVRPLRAQPDQIPCVFEGGILRNGKCVCRGWGRDLDKYEFSPPASRRVTSDRVGALRAAAATRLCPNVETRYCHGWATRSGECGVFGKAADFAQGPIVKGAKVGEAQCYRSYTKIIKDSKDKIFGSPGNCGEQIAFMNMESNKVEIWKYNTSTGDYTTQGDSNVRPTNGGNGPAGAALPNSVAELKTLCDGVRVGSTSAAWIDASASCRCGSRTLDQNEVLASETRETFTRICKSTMGGGSVAPTGASTSTAFQTAQPAIRRSCSCHEANQNPKFVANEAVFNSNKARIRARTDDGTMPPQGRVDDATYRIIMNATR